MYENIYSNEIKELKNGTGDDAKLYTDMNGNILVAEYRIFSGISVVYYSGHSESVLMKNVENSFIEINHCREGRIEYENENFLYYLSAGDISIGKSCTETLNFPVCCYSGVSILIETDNSDKSFSDFLSDMNIDLSYLVNKYCGKNNYSVRRSDPYIKNIFSKFYSVPVSVKKSYIKIKILELLLYLMYAENDNYEIINTSCSAVHMRLAKEMQAYLIDNIDHHITIAQLAEKFHISESQLKNIFRNAYGMSVYAYIKMHKMQTAASMLKDTDYSIMEIALDLGYSNASKFSAAFKDIMGISPNLYRNSHNER